MALFAGAHLFQPGVVDGGSGLAPSGRVLSSPTVARSIHIPCSHSSSLRMHLPAHCPYPGTDLACHYGVLGINTGDRAPTICAVL